MSSKFGAKMLLLQCLLNFKTCELLYNQMWFSWCICVALYTQKTATQVKAKLLIQIYEGSRILFPQNHIPKSD